jgi:hypothetical protein
MKAYKALIALDLKLALRQTGRSSSLTICSR